jgi:hypothetical protein
VVLEIKREPYGYSRQSNIIAQGSGRWTNVALWITGLVFGLITSLRIQYFPLLMRYIWMFIYVLMFLHGM